MTFEEACKKIESAAYATTWLLEHTQPTTHAFLTKCALLDLCKDLNIYLDRHAQKDDKTNAD